MVDLSKPVELSFVFFAIGLILLATAVGIYLVKKYANAK